MHKKKKSSMTNEYLMRRLSSPLLDFNNQPQMFYLSDLLVSGFRGRGRRKVRSVFDGFRDFQAEAGKNRILQIVK